MVDSDGDGLSDVEETTIYHTDPNLRDTDGDDYEDGVEVVNGYSPSSGEKLKLSKADTDKDGLSDELEIKLKTHLNNPDTDGDGMQDGKEVNLGYNPLAGNNDRSLPRRVEVDLSQQQVYVYLNNVKVFTMPVSTGVRGRETPKGEFKISVKKPFVNYVGPGYNYPNTKWNLEFKPRYYLHGAYWHNQFGKRPMSHGCVNIAYKNAEKLYNFLDKGDKVKVFGITPRGLVNANIAKSP